MIFNTDLDGLAVPSGGFSAGTIRNPAPDHAYGEDYRYTLSLEEWKALTQPGVAAKGGGVMSTSTEQVIAVMLSDVNRFSRKRQSLWRNGGYTPEALIAFLKEPSAWRFLEDRIRLADPDHFPLWNVGQGIGVIRKAVSGKTVVLASNLGYPFSSYRGGSSSELAPDDFSGWGWQVETAGTITRQLPWWWPAPNASPEKRKALWELFLKTLQQRARHSTDPAKSFDRMLSIASQYYIDQKDVPAIVADSYGELTRRTVNRILQQINKPPKGWPTGETNAR